MTGIALHYHMDTEAPVKALNALARTDRIAMLQEIAEMVIEDTLNNFDLEQGPDGTQWTPSLRNGKPYRTKAICATALPM